MCIRDSLEPLVAGGGVVEHHVQHDTDAPLLRLGGQGLKVGHGTVAGVDGAVVGHVVAVVVLWGDKEGGQQMCIRDSHGTVKSTASPSDSGSALYLSQTAWAEEGNVPQLLLDGATLIAPGGTGMYLGLSLIHISSTYWFRSALALVS